MTALRPLVALISALAAAQIAMHSAASAQTSSGYATEARTGPLPEPRRLALQGGAEKARNPDGRGLSQEHRPPPIDAVNAGALCAASPDRDEAVCLQRALDAACAGSNARGGNVVYLPPGTYTITSTVTVHCDGVRIVGAGIGHRDSAQRGTALRCSVTSGPCIRFAKRGSKNYSYGGGIEHLSFVNPVEQGSGTAVSLQVEHAQNFHAQNLYFWAPFQAIKVIAGAHNTFYAIHMEAVLPGGTGIEVTGAFAGGSIEASQATRNDTTTFQDIFMSAGGVVTPSAKHPTCLAIRDFAATTVVRSLQCLNPHDGVVISCAPGATIDACPAFMDFRDLEIDFAHGRNLVASDFQSLKCFGCYFHGSESTIENVALFNRHYNASWSAQFIGGKADGALGTCFASQVGATVVQGMDIHNCNRGGAGAAGLTLFGPRPDAEDATGNNVIVGNTFCRFRGAAPTRMGAITIRPGVEATTVVANVFADCAAGVAGAGPEANHQVGLNAGP